MARKKKEQGESSVNENEDSKQDNSACVHGFIDANDGIVYQTLP